MVHAATPQPSVTPSNLIDVDQIYHSTTTEFARRRANLSFKHHAEVLAEMAARVRDWPLLLQAAEQKLEDIERLVAWWDENVPGKGRPKNRTDHVPFSQADAEDVCGYSHMQISRWHKARQEREKFLSHIVRAAYRKAGIEPQENHRAEGTTPDGFIGFETSRRREDLPFSRLRWPTDAASPTRHAHRYAVAAGFSRARHACASANRANCRITALSG
jgi:hypothetical protein